MGQSKSQDPDPLRVFVEEGDRALREGCPGGSGGPQFISHPPPPNTDTWRPSATAGIPPVASPFSVPLAASPSPSPSPLLLPLTWQPSLS